MNKRKFDYFNFLYSIGAVIILIGVIAKFLEWKQQDTLLLLGLSVEAFVFTISSIQFKEEKIKYKWENIFPEIVEKNGERMNSIGSKEIIDELYGKYIITLQGYISKFEKVNEQLTKESALLLESSTFTSSYISNSKTVYNDLLKTFDKLNSDLASLAAVEENIKLLNISFEKLGENSNISSSIIEELNDQVYDLKESTAKFSVLANGILTQFKSVKI